MFTPGSFIKRYRNHWNLFAKEILRVKLDEQQQEILHVVQKNRKVSVQSGHARGKDFLAAVSALCFLYTLRPCKVICTAPTGRQAINIMMAEISRLYEGAVIPLGGRLVSNMIKFDKDKTTYLISFKAADTDIEAWQGFHSENIFSIMTEATGFDDSVFTAQEGILTGNSKQLLVYNPIKTEGMAYSTAFDPSWKHFELNCLNSPNVLAKEIIIPGQVDWEWVDDKVHKDGWTIEIRKEEFTDEWNDFEWEGKYYRPTNLFLMKVMGKFPREGSDTLIPLQWIVMANKRWEERRNDREYKGAKVLGVDVAGIGRDEGMFVYRSGNYIEKIISVTLPEVREKIHMKIAGMVKKEIGKGYHASIDTIGEGAGIFSRLVEMEMPRCISGKGSFSAKGYTDMTEEREFANMRAYMYWCLRDALDPQYGFDLALPPDRLLTQELNTIKYNFRSKGDIILEKKEDIKKRINRSPDRADALALTFFPIDNDINSEVIGTYEY